MTSQQESAQMIVAATTHQANAALLQCTPVTVMDEPDAVIRATASEYEDDEATVANLLEHNQRGGDQVERGLKIGRAFPNESPNPV